MFNIPFGSFGSIQNLHNYLKPSSYTNTGTWASPGNAYDLSSVNDTSTYSSKSISRILFGITISSCTWNFGSNLPTENYTSKILYINWEIAAITDTGLTSPSLELSYSTDSGTNWNLIDFYYTVTTGQASVLLSSTQDLTTLKIRAVVRVNVEIDNDLESIEGRVKDIWVDGLY